MSKLQQTYNEYLQKRATLEDLETKTQSEIHEEQTKVALRQTLVERMFPKRMISDVYKQTHKTQEKNEAIKALNEKERALVADKEALLQEIISIQNTLPTIVLLSAKEVEKLESLNSRILSTIAQIEVILIELKNKLSSSDKKATTGIIGEGADLLLENRRNKDSKGILSKSADVISTLLTQRAFSSRDELNEKIKQLSPLLEELNKLVHEIGEVEEWQGTIDQRKKPIKDIREAKNMRAVEYLDLFQDIILPNTKVDLGSIISLVVQAYTKNETQKLHEQVRILQERLKEVKRGAQHIQKDIDMYHALMKGNSNNDDDDVLVLRPLT